MLRIVRAPLDPSMRREDGTLKPGTRLNAKGRPRGSKAKGATRLEILQELVSVHSDGKKKRMPAGEALFRKVVIDAIKGDKACMILVLKEWIKLEEQREKAEEAAYVFTETDRALISEIHARMKACKPLAR